jgi:ubiquinone/menaquinone biosynthesis C-methylase UbiE
MHTSHSSHAGDQPHSHAPETRGRTIHWAKYYDLSVNLLMLGQSRRLRAWTIDSARIQPGETVLDVGCGTGDLTLAAKRAAGAGARVYGIDASPEMIGVAQKKTALANLQIEYRLEPIEHLSFTDNSFDVVLSSLMVHHLPDDLKRAGLQEIYRVLKPRGRLVIVDFRRPAGHGEHILAHLLWHGGMSRGVQDLPELMRGLGYMNATAEQAGLPLLGIARGEKKY